MFTGCTAWGTGTIGRGGGLFWAAATATLVFFFFTRSGDAPTNFSSVKPVKNKSTTLCKYMSLSCVLKAILIIY